MTQAAPLLFGAETEYALSLFPPDGRCIGRSDLAAKLIEAASRELPSLRSVDARGVFLANGARLYVDWLDHPEYATPECTCPFELANRIEQGDAILLALAGRVAAETGCSLCVLKGNMDYSGSGTTWGCHENYLARGGADLERHLAPFLVSRLVYAGAGGWNNLSRSLEFLISPRAVHLRRVSSKESSWNRGVLHTKSESLARPGYRRVHLLLGESLGSQTAVALKWGTTALVLRLLELGAEPGNGIAPVDPLDALLRFACDPSCGARARTVDGRWLSAIDIQRCYLRLVRNSLDILPSWAAAVCSLWQDVLNGLEDGSEFRCSRLDWVIKLRIYGSGAPIRSEPGFLEAETRFLQLGDDGLFGSLDRAGLIRHRVHPAGFSSPPVATRASSRGAAIARLSQRESTRFAFQAGWDRVEGPGMRLDLSDPFEVRSHWAAGSQNRTSADADAPAPLDNVTATVASPLTLPCGRLKGWV